MQTEELTIKLVSTLTTTPLGTQEMRRAIEKILYNYNITTKETLPALNDNMNERILLYLASRKIEGLSENSLKHYSRVLKRFSTHLRKNVEDVTTMCVRMYLNNYTNTGIKNTTLATHTDVIRRFFRWLVDEGYIQTNPLNRITTTKVAKRLREALTKEEFEILRGGALSLRQKALLETFYSTGCRLSEVVNMKLSDIDWQGLKITVIGKGNKQRIVYINSPMKVHVRNYIASRVDDDCPYLFVSLREPVRKMQGRTIQDEVRKIQKNSQLGKNVFPHLLRHTCATHLLNAGMGLTVLQEILGHDDSSTTLVYASIDKRTIDHEFRKYS